jgi:hypothetical protein
MDLVLIKEGTDEWNDMWSIIETHPINEGLEEPKAAFNQGESWQYMSSYLQNDKLLHEFRHRLHPRTNKLEQIVLNSSNKFTDDQIAFKKKVR